MKKTFMLILSITIAIVGIMIPLKMESQTILDFKSKKFSIHIYEEGETRIITPGPGVDTINYEILNVTQGNLSYIFASKRGKVKAMKAGNFPVLNFGCLPSKFFFKLGKELTPWWIKTTEEEIQRYEDAKELFQIYYDEITFAKGNLSRSTTPEAVLALLVTSIEVESTQTLVSFETRTSEGTPEFVGIPEIIKTEITPTSPTANEITETISNETVEYKKILAEVIVTPQVETEETNIFFSRINTNTPNSVMESSLVNSDNEIVNTANSFFKNSILSSIFPNDVSEEILKSNEKQRLIQFETSSNSFATNVFWGEEFPRKGEGKKIGKGKLPKESLIILLIFLGRDFTKNKFISEKKVKAKANTNKLRR